MFKPKFINSVISSSFLKGSLLLFLGSFVGNVAGYVYHIAVGRILGPEKYATVGAMVSILYVVNVPAGVITTILTKQYAQLNASMKHSESKALFLDSIKAVGVIALVSGVIIIPFTSSIALFLHIDSPSQIYILYLTFITVLLGMVGSAFVIGYQQFAINSLYLGGSSLLRLILGSLTAFYGVSATLFSNVVSNLISLFLFYPALKSLPKDKIKSSLNVHKILFGNIGPVISLLCMASLFSMDVVIVKSKFSASEAGIYASLSVLGKVIYFATLFFVQAIFPILTEKWQKKLPVIPLMVQSLLTVTGISAAITTVYLIFPSIVVRSLFGIAFDAAIPLVSNFAFFMMFFCVSNLLVMMYMAVGLAYVWIPLVIAVVLQIVLLEQVAYDLKTVVQINLIICGILTLLLLPFIYKIYDREKK